MKQKHNLNIVNRYTVSTLAVLIAVLTAYAALTVKPGTTKATPSSKTTSQLPQKTPGNPQFLFNAADAAGWRQGPTDKISMALFQDGYNCFASVQYKPGTVGVAAEHEKKQASDTDLGLTSTLIATLTATLQTGEGQKQYQLHQYSVSGTAGGQKVKGGQEFGYLQLPNGYIEIEGHCDTADQLPATIPALQAIEFDDCRD